MRRWRVRPDENDATVAQIVARAGGDARAVADGRVFVGRKRVQNANERVRCGDEVSIAPPADEERADVVVLAHEDDVLAVLKPAGIPTIPDHAGAAHALVARAARLAGVDESRLHPTSRLDRDVSGVVVFALSRAAADRLKRARDAGTYARRYVAIAARAPSPTSAEARNAPVLLARAPVAGVWDAPIGRGKDARTRAAHGKDAVPARTTYAVVAVAAGRTEAMLAVSPITGRTHQIRVHASVAGAPLLGDRAYGGPARVTLATGRVVDLRRVALHAARVSVPRARGAELVVSAPVPEDLRNLWGLLGGDPSAWDAAVTCAIEDS